MEGSKRPQPNPVPHQDETPQTASSFSSETILNIPLAISPQPEQNRPNIDIPLEEGPARKGTVQQMSIEKRQAQRKKRRLRRNLILLVGLLLILLLAWGLTSLISNLFGQDEVGAVASVPSGAPAISGASGLTAEPLPDTVDSTSWNFVGPTEQTISGMQLISPDYRMLSLPENGRVDMSYFSTVTFVGDSLTQGFQIYQQGIANATYCAYIGVGPKQMFDGSIQRRQDGEQEIPLDALVSYKPRNVYIQLGANAMVSMDDASLLAYYQEMLNTFRAVLPATTNYYIQSLTPVRPDNDPGFDIARITSLNNQLAVLAYQNNLHFLDLTEALSGDDGYLMEEYAAGDGYHLSPTGYGVWVDYLVTHTAYTPLTPYLEGSPFYNPEAVAAAEAAAAEVAAAEAAVAEAAAAEAAAAEAAAAEAAAAEAAAAEAAAAEAAAAEAAAAEAAAAEAAAAAAASTPPA